MWRQPNPYRWSRATDHNVAKFHFDSTETMTIETQALKSIRLPKKFKNMGERLLEARDRAAAKIPKNDWDCMPTDSSPRLESES